MNPSDDLVQQLREYLKVEGYTQKELAEQIGVTVQTLNTLLSGKRSVLGHTLESTLLAIKARVVLLGSQENPQEVHDQALNYGLKLFSKASAIKHQTFASCVAWLCTANPKGLNRTIRSLAVQDQLSPLLSIEQATYAVLPLVYGELSKVHQKVVIEQPEGDDHWDSVQVRLWQTKLKPTE